MGCFYSKGEFPTQEVMVAIAGAAGGKPPKPAPRRFSIDREGTSTRTSSQDGEIPRVIIHKDSETAALEAAAEAAAAQAAEGGNGAASPRKKEDSRHKGEGGVEADEESHINSEAASRTTGGDTAKTQNERKVRKPAASAGRESLEVVLLDGDPAEDLPRVVVHKDPEDAVNFNAADFSVEKNRAKLPAKDPRPETPALPVSAAVGAKGLQQAAAELRTAVAEVENKASAAGAGDNDRNNLAAPRVSPVPIITEPDSDVSSPPTDAD